MLSLSCLNCPSPNAALLHRDPTQGRCRAHADVNLHTFIIVLPSDSGQCPLGVRRARESHAVQVHADSQEKVLTTPRFGKISSWIGAKRVLHDDPVPLCVLLRIIESPRRDVTCWHHPENRWRTENGPQAPCHLLWGRCHLPPFPRFRPPNPPITQRALETA